MSKDKTKEEWINWFKKYEMTLEIPKEYFESLNSRDLKVKYQFQQPSYSVMKGRRHRFINKYKKWKMLDNMFMVKKQETRGRKPKRDIEGFVKNLTREQLEEIAKVHIKQNEKKNDKKASYSHFSKTEMAFVLNIHRTTLYKARKRRVYKLDKFKKFLISSTKAKVYTVDAK